MDKYSTTYFNLEKIVKENCPTFTPDAILGYIAIKVNNLNVQKHPWTFKIYVKMCLLYNYLVKYSNCLIPE